METADTSTRRQVISQETCDAIIDILQQNAESGSASGGYVAGYRVCGKTGTSEKVDKWNEDRTQDMEYIASYCASPRRRTPNTPCWCSLMSPMTTPTAATTAATPWPGPTSPR